MDVHVPDHRRKDDFMKFVFCMLIDLELIYVTLFLNCVYHRVYNSYNLD